MKTEQAINNDREFVAQVIRALPKNMDPNIKQCWIENPRGLSKVLTEVLCPPAETSSIHAVCLASVPDLPFVEAQVVKHDGEINGKRLVKIELRSDDNLYLYILLGKHLSEPGVQ